MAKTRKIYYQMGEVSEMLDIPASTVRFWESNTKVLSPRKNKKGNRQFTADDVSTLKMLHNLTKERGMTIAGAEQKILSERMSLKKNVSTIELLQQVRASLVTIRDEIKTSIEGKKGVTLVNNDEDDIDNAPKAKSKPKVNEPTLF